MAQLKKPRKRRKITLDYNEKKSIFILMYHTLTFKEVAMAK